MIITMIIIICHIENQMGMYIFQFPDFFHNTHLCELELNLFVRTHIAVNLRHGAENGVSSYLKKCP